MHDQMNWTFCDFMKGFSLFRDIGYNCYEFEAWWAGGGLDSHYSKLECLAYFVQFLK